MNPLSLRLRNLRSFERLDLNLPEGCVSITGENGAGKSTLVNAIDAALFGASGRSFRPSLTRGAEGTELMVELVFDHAGETYRVRRGYSARGAGKSTLDLERWKGEPLHSGDDTGPMWDALTLGSAKETQALLEQTLGFNRATFRASSFLMQRDASAFTLADPADRKKILMGSLGLERYKTLQEAVRRDLRSTRQEVDRIDGRLQGVTRDALVVERANTEAIRDQFTATAESATAALVAAETELEKAANLVQAVNETVAARATATARRDAAVEALAAKAMVRVDAEQAETQAGIVRDEIAALATPAQLAALEEREHQIVRVLEAHAAAQREHDDAAKLYELRAAEKKTIEAQAAQTDARMRELDAKAAHLEMGELDNCPTCQQKLGVEARKETVLSLRAQAQQLAEEAAAFFERAGAILLPVIPDAPAASINAELAELDTVREQWRRAREAEVQRSRLEERLAGYQRLIDVAAGAEYQAELAVHQANLQALEADLAGLPPAVDVAPLELAVVEARARVQHERNRLQIAERDKAVAEERLAQLTVRAEQLERDLAAQETHQAEIDLLAILERAYGPDGIPALILENAAIPQLESEASRILQLLGGPVTRVELRTDRAKQDGGIRDDVLDIVCVTDTGDCVYDDLSGGEGFRVDVALRLALAQLLATRRGAEVKLLVIDEPDGLDASGKQALIEILRDLEQRGGLSRIYLISHDAEIRDSFDTSLVVVKDPDGRSRVAGADVPAEVAA